jgi:phenylacetate-CoA ligase
MVTPSYMLTLLDEMERQGLEPTGTSLRIGIFGAEPWTEAMRHTIEARAGLDAVDIYGLSEVMGPGVANECIESKDGPVLWEDHFYPEIIDPNTGEVLPEGSLGELVLTSLTKVGLPVIRYRTRDLTRLLPPTARSMRRMGKITGRSDDMLIIRGVNIFPTQIEELICRMPELAPHYLLVVDKEGHLDQLTVQVEARSSGNNSVRQALAQTLQHRIKGSIGISCVVEVGAPFAIERVTVGKARRVLDRRPAN